MGRKRGEYYVNPDDLKSEILKYQATGNISEELGLMFLNIANKLKSKWNFRNYSYDFTGDAIIRMIKNLNKIDLTISNSNPFSYLTQICWNSFVAKINKEKKNQLGLERYKDKVYNDFEINENIEHTRCNSEDDY